jgi:hypothetical protein
MNRKIAVTSFLSICLILAVLLLTKIITSTISGIIFAIALALFGSLSKGFRTEKALPKTKDGGDD